MSHKTLNCTLQVFNIRYPEMHKVQGAKCAISKLMYGLSRCTDDNHSLKLLAYHLVHMNKPYINLHLVHLSSVQHREMHKVQGAKCAISKLMYGLSVCSDDNRSPKLLPYRLVHTDEPYINLNTLGTCVISYACSQNRIKLLDIK